MTSAPILTAADANSLFRSGLDPADIDRLRRVILHGAGIRTDEDLAAAVEAVECVLASCLYVPR